MPHRRAYLHVNSDALTESTFALTSSLSAFLGSVLDLDVYSMANDSTFELEMYREQVPFKVVIGINARHPQGFIRFPQKSLELTGLASGDLVEFSPREGYRSAEVVVHKLQAAKPDLERMPDALMSWSGSASGAVQVVFEDKFGNPCRKAYETQLIRRIHSLSEQVRDGKIAPKVVMLAGGAGNGKTHAVQHLLEQIAEDKTGLASEFRKRSKDRLVKFDLRSTDKPLFSKQIQGVKQLWVVQDASEADPSGATPEDLLNSAIKEALGSEGIMLLVCVNRGVLYGAAAKAKASGGSNAVADFLGNVVLCLDPLGIDRDCWPMGSHKDCFVWPLDIDSLFEAVGKDVPSVGQQVLAAIYDQKWSLVGEISDSCPLLYARNLLSQDRSRKAFSELFRVYEVLAGRNIPFRGMLSSFSYLLTMGRSGDEPQPSRLARITLGDLHFDSSVPSAWNLYSRSLPFLMFPRLPTTVALREKLSNVKSREELGFLLLLADEVDRLNSVVSDRALTPGADLFCSSASGWSDLVDPAVCSLDRKVIEAAFDGASSGDLDSLVQLEELCHLDPSRAMSLISSGIDAGSHAVLRHLCECRSKIGELMERHQLFELQWFSRWISRLFASIAKRSLGVICLMRGHRLVQNGPLISEYMRLSERPDLDKVSSVSNFIFAGDSEEDGDHVIQLGKGLCQPYPEAGSASLKFEGGVPEPSIPMNAGVGEGSTRPRFGGVVIEIGEEGVSFKMPVTPSMYFLVCDMRDKNLLAGSVPAAIRGAIDAFRLGYDGVQVHDRTKFKLKLGNSEKNVRINSLAQANILER